MRFKDIERDTRLNPAQVDRALKVLVGGTWIVPETLPSTTGRILVRYALSKRGAALLKALDAFRASLRRHEDALGPAVLRDMDALYA